MTKETIADESIKVKNIGVEIEALKAANTDLDYIECTIEIATRLGIDVEDMKAILPKAIKEKIEADALRMNLLTYKTNTLI